MNMCKYSRFIFIFIFLLILIYFRIFKTVNYKFCSSFIRETIASNEVDSLEFRIGKICLSNPSE